LGFGLQEESMVKDFKKNGEKQKKFTREVEDKTNPCKFQSK
jgi:hypothetical protein